MGYSISWIAIRGKTKDQVLEDLQLVETDELDEANESPVSGAELPTGWYVLFLNDLTHPFIETPVLQRLSRGCELVGAQIEEHVMFSGSFFYRDGRREWNISHDAQQNLEHLEAEGTLPPAFTDAKTANLKLQAERGEAEGVDDVFDIPLDVSERFCGYRHDRWKFEWGEPRFTTLVEAAR